MLLVNQLIEGISRGTIYASLALAIVLILRSTRIANFAQGEMAMLSTYVTWQLLSYGFPAWLAVLLTLTLSALVGAVLERVVLRPVEGANPLVGVMVTFGIYLAINSLAGTIWSYQTRSFPSPFSSGVLDLGQIRLTWQTAGTVGVLVAEIIALWLLFQKTRIGLAMRAATSNPASSELVGINIGRVYMLGWALAAMLGSLAGLLIAPRVFLEPNMMSEVLIYAFAGAALGGMESPLGAVLGSLLLGITESLAIAYLPFLGSDLKVLVPLAVICLVLLVLPTGLFGAKTAGRV